MKTLYMMVGLPGSGKSTLVQKLIEQKAPNGKVVIYGHMILSTDKFVEGYACIVGKDYNEVFKEAMPVAEKKLQEDLKFAVEEGWDIYWDQTNLSVKGRAKKLARVPKDYRRVAVVVRPDDKQLQEQLDKRVAEGGKYIAPKVVEDMRKTYEPPSLDEGFDKIIWE